MPLGLESQAAIVVSDSLVQNNRAPNPLPIPLQLGLQPPAGINKLHIPRRTTKVAHAPSVATTIGRASRNVQNLPRVNQIGILNPIHPRNLLPRRADLRPDRSQRVTLPHGKLLWSRGLGLTPTLHPAETAPVIGENLVQADAARSVRAILALARGMEKVFSGAVDADVLGGTAKVAEVLDTRGGALLAVSVVLLFLLFLGLLLLLVLLPLLVLLLLLRLSLLLRLLVLFGLLLLGLLVVATVLPVGDAVLELVACEGTADYTEDGWRGC